MRSGEEVLMIERSTGDMDKSGASAEDDTVDEAVKNG